MELKKVIEIVRDKYNEVKYIDPVVIIESPNDKKKVGILPLDLSSQDMKDAYKKLCSKVINNIKPTKYFFVAEAVWRTTYADLKQQPYTETPNDCIVIAEYNKNMKVKLIQINIKNKKLGKTQVFDKIDSADEWNFYLAK